MNVRKKGELKHKLLVVSLICIVDNARASDENGLAVSSNSQYIFLLIK